MHYAPFDDPNRGSDLGAPRLATKALLALQILQREPRGLYGLQVVAKSNGRLHRASIYLVLGDLQHQGLVHGKRVSELGWIPRPLYTISSQGLRVLANCELRGTEPWTRST